MSNQFLRHQRMPVNQIFDKRIMHVKSPVSHNSCGGCSADHHWQILLTVSQPTSHDRAGRGMNMQIWLMTTLNVNSPRCRWSIPVGSPHMATYQQQRNRRGAFCNGYYSAFAPYPSTNFLVGFAIISGCILERLGAAAPHLPPWRRYCMLQKLTRRWDTPTSRVLTYDDKL